MFDVTVTQEQIDYAERTVKTFNFGNRGYGDGNTREQFTGILGQTVVADLLGCERPTGGKGFDGGTDYIINGKRVDIKTMTRSVPMRSYFVHNFVAYQKPYEVDYYIFASYNTKTSTLTVCGYIDKKQFFEKADFFPKGAERTRSNGTSFFTTSPNYEIIQSLLRPVNCVEDIVKGIT